MGSAQSCLKPACKQVCGPSLAQTETFQHRSQKAAVIPNNVDDQSDVIAIVGIGCRTPGADNIQDFWRVLKNGECHISSDIPKDRWNADAFLDLDPNALGKAYVQKAGLIKDVEGFDNSLYGINDFEAAQMDPQQSLLLDCATMALQDAGITRQQLAGSNTGVFVGTMNTDYVFAYLGHTSKVNMYTTTGVSNTILASRLSYVFDLRGPCMVIDTACSASLVAIHQACLAIRSGDCDMALCGGANCILLPDMFVKLSKARMISPTGLCHTFSNEADGYTRGEGCGVVILKRLNDALRDGDKVWATLNTGTNQDGRSVTPITAPSGQQQKQLLHAMYDKYHVDIAALDYIEAHGTGTPAGDPVEVNALGTCLKERDSQPRTRYIGSVKTNIGHTESAAGVLGLIKVLLMMKHSTIVASLHCKTVNPKIDLSYLTFVIPDKHVPWNNPHKIAVCNSFGFGGSNAHAVLYSFARTSTERHSASSSNKKKACIVCFSGKTEKSLRGSMEDLYADAQVPLLSLSDVAYTSTVRRDHFPYRVAIVAEDVSDLLNSVTEKLSSDNWSPPALAKPNVVFVFCGMGTAWDGMCRQLLKEMPVFRKAVEKVDSHLSSHVKWSLVKRLREENLCDDPVLAPIAIFACQVGLAAVWRSLGVRPYSVVGQSVGEVAAAYFAGCIGLADAVSIMYHRSRLLAEVTGGRMVVVQNVEVEKVRQVTEQVGDVWSAISIAVEYSPRACAISTDSRTMAKLRPVLLSELKPHHRDMQLVDLDVSVAYHSSHVASAADKLRGFTRGVKSMAPRLNFVSTVTGKAVTEPLESSHWEDNMKKSVLFRQAIVASVPSKESSSTLFLEIGPRPVLRAHMADLFPGKQFITAIPSVTKTPEVKSLYQAIGTCYERGLDISWKKLPAEVGSALTDVPRYCFDKKYLRQKTEVQILYGGGCNMFRKNHLFVFPVDGPGGTYKVMLSPLTLSSIYEHVVSGSIVVPGALYAEVGFAVAKYSRSTKHVSVSVDFQHLQVLEKDQVVDIDIVPDVSHLDDPRQYFVKRAENQLAVIRCHVSEESGGQANRYNVASLRSRCTEHVPKTEIYSSLKQFGFEYGDSFSLLTDGMRNSDECLVTLQTTEQVRSEMADMTIHPSVLDCMLQATTLLAAQNGNKNQKMLPKAIGRISVCGKKEEVMLIHVKLKSQDSKFWRFHMRLLSNDGLVIAEVSEFVFQVLASQDTSDPDMLLVQWNKVRDITPDWFKTERKDRADILIITEADAEIPVQSRSGTTVLKYPSLSDTSSFRQDLSKQMTAHKFDALVLVIPKQELDEITNKGELDEIMNKGELDEIKNKGDGDTQSSRPHVTPKEELSEIDNKEDGEAIQSTLINVCLLIQAVAIELNTNEPNTPFYVLTFNAFPSPNGAKGQDVNPAATAVWGLMRTAVAEVAFFDVKAVEVHGSGGHSQITHDFLHGLHDILRDEAVAGYPEVMITDNAVYVNQVAQAVMSTMSPKQRSLQAVNIEDVHGGVILLSKDAANLTNIKTAHYSSSPPTANVLGKVSIKVDAFAQPPPTLSFSHCSAEYILPRKSDAFPDYVVMAVEVCGTNTEQSGEQLISCCHLPVGPVVSVPAETVVETAWIPDYQVGDLSKLVLLWSLLDQRPGGDCTILASKSTHHFALVLKLLCCGSDTAHSNKVTILNVDELHEDCSFGSCILSLVSIDIDLMVFIEKRWERADRFVSFASLVNADVRTFLACVLSHVGFHLIDVQSLFQQTQLRKAVPKLKEWVTGNSVCMFEVSKQLHCEASNDRGCDSVNALFNLTARKLSDLVVTAAEDKLFLHSGIYVVVGGLTGLGWLCVEFLAENEAGYIAIINRRAASAEKTAEMKTLSEKFHCNINSFQADISNMESLDLGLREITTWGERGEIRGVFAGAAVVQDSSFHTTDGTAFEKVLTPKVKGMWNLHQLTKHVPLDYFVMHSSVASVLGNHGQANYSAGNAFVDGLAFHRIHHGLTAQTINWGPLDTGLLDNQDAKKKRLDAMGFQLDGKDVIKKKLRVLLRLNLPQAVPVTLNSELYANRINNSKVRAQINRFKNLLAASSAAEDDKYTGSVSQNVNKFRLLDSPQRCHQYQEYVRELTMRVLNAGPHHVSNTVSLYSLGLDSVAGMMMLNVIERQTGFRLETVVVLSSDVTVASIAQALDDSASCCN